MGEKDIAEKTLETFNDVFSDIVNVLLFNGEKVIEEKALKDATTHSVYKVDKKLREQIRDTAKYWEHNQIHVAFIGFENQTEQESDLPLRIIGYDGASYRNQLYYEKTKEGERRKNINPRYPVITIVLYFGIQHWNKSLSLYECLDIPEKLKKFTNDYKVNLFEIAYISDEQLAMFQSDFRIVAEYFMQLRKGNNYTPTKKDMIHVQEVLQLMSIFSGDKRYEEVYNNAEDKGEIKNMCDLLDRIENKGIEKGMQKGIEKGIEKGIVIGLERGKLNMLYSLVQDNTIPLSVAAKHANMLEEDFEKGMKDYLDSLQCEK